MAGRSLGFTGNQMRVLIPHSVGANGGNFDSGVELFSAAKDCGDDTRVAAAVNDGDYPQRIGIGSVGNQVFPNQLESERTRRKFGSEEPTMRKLNQQLECIKELTDQSRCCSMSGITVVGGYFIEIANCFGMKFVCIHAMDL
jgi:hypothetical protein